MRQIACRVAVEPSHRLVNIGLCAHVGGDLRARPAQPIARQVRRAERKSDRKRAATAELAVHADLAAMQLDQLLHQREPDAAALEGSSARAFHAAETLEQVRQLVRAGCPCRCHAR